MWDKFDQDEINYMLNHTEWFTIIHSFDFFCVKRIGELKGILNLSNTFNGDSDLFISIHVKITCLTNAQQRQLQAAWRVMRKHRLQHTDCAPEAPFKGDVLGPDLIMRQILWVLSSRNELNIENDCQPCNVHNLFTDQKRASLKSLVNNFKKKPCPDTYAVLWSVIHSTDNPDVIALVLDVLDTTLAPNNSPVEMITGGSSAHSILALPGPMIP
jgi:hypothetical protein